MSVMPSRGTGWPPTLGMVLGGGSTSTGSNRLWELQPIVNLHTAVDEGQIDARVPVLTTVETVFVTVAEAAMVVSLSTVAVVSMTVGPAVDVTTTLPFDVYVVGATVMKVTDTIVVTGMLATVELVTTVSNVVKGRVRVAVMIGGGADVEPFCGVAVTSVGCKVDCVTVDILVGNGWIGGFPSVAIVVMIDPDVAGELWVAFVVVGD